MVEIAAYLVRLDPASQGSRASGTTGIAVAADADDSRTATQRLAGSGEAMR
jgi:hypothetical protein